MTLNRDITIKQVITIFALVAAIYGGLQGVSAIAGNVSSKQINEHAISTEEKHTEQFLELRYEQSIIQTDVAVTKERVKTMGDDISDIKEMMRNRP